MNSVDTILKIINEGMEKKDRYITLYFGEEGTKVSVHPLLNEHNDTENKKVVGYWRKKLDPFYFDRISGELYHEFHYVYICSECEYVASNPTDSCPHCKASLPKIVDETEYEINVMP